MNRIDFGTLRENGWADYMDEHMSFISDVNKLAAYLAKGEVKTGIIFGIIVLQGKLQVKIDNIDQQLHDRQALVCPVNSVISDYLSSPDLRAYVICISPDFFKELYINNQAWEYYQYVSRHHITNFSDSDWQRFIYYYELMRDNMTDKGKKYQRQIMKSLWKSLIFEFICVIDRYVKHVRSEDAGISNGETVSARFIELLAVDEGKTHSVAEFAAQLFVTPKYLSTVVSSTTGKSALKWIHESMSKEIGRQLLNSDKSLKEIADMLNFPNASFFGKFVKEHLGDTPANIRRRYHQAQHSG